MSLDAMLADLPKVCDRGTKKNARGIRETWRGCRLPVDTADCGVPLGAILTSASLHDSRVAMPLATMTAGRVVNLHGLTDSACDAHGIHTVSKRFGPVPIIATNPRRDKALEQALNREARAQRAAGHPDARTVRYRIRPVVERTNARLEDAFGARHVRVRGPAKVACHPMSGLLALTADRIICLTGSWRRPTIDDAPGPGIFEDEGGKFHGSGPLWIEKARPSAPARESRRGVLAVARFQDEPAVAVGALDKTVGAHAQKDFWMTQRPAAVAGHVPLGHLHDFGSLGFSHRGQSLPLKYQVSSEILPIAPIRTTGQVNAGRHSVFATTLPTLAGG